MNINNKVLITGDVLFITKVTRVSHKSFGKKLHKHIYSILLLFNDDS